MRTLGVGVNRDLTNAADTARLRVLRLPERLRCSGRRADTPDLPLGTAVTAYPIPEQRRTV
jgi:hypothetical protein